MAPPPVVTGLSPNEGPPGTRITIRGENFGSSPTDLIGLTICGCDCLLSAEWKSSNKIIARSGPGKGKGDVVVSTRLGGVGTCNVNFKGYYETIGPMKESAVWVEEAPLFAWGRHSLSPSSYQQDDPLGLSVEGNDKKISEDDLLDLYPGSTGDITSENFSAGWFLLENHQATSFNDLQAGLLCLGRKVESQKKGQLSFLKANIGSVMDQVDTIVNLKERFEGDVRLCGTEPTLKLEKAIKESEREARKLFDDVLARRDRAEKTRNALNVLSRFRFLFCLPCTIDRNVKKGDYDIVINDYMRVRNLFHKTEVPVFKAALKEIQKRIVNLQKMLHEKLQEMPVSIEEQKRLIKHLVNLDTPFEPAWDAIQSHSDYINFRLKECYDEHKAAEASFADDVSKSKNAHSASKYKYTNALQETQIVIPENILFLEDICHIISELFPNLWKLGQAYFTGELQVKVEPRKHVEFKHMVLTIMESFSKTIRTSTIPHTLPKPGDKSMSWTMPNSEILAEWLPTCLRRVRTAYLILIKLDLPSDALDIILRVILDLKIHCITILFKQKLNEIKRLHTHESWKIEFSGTHNGITNLPVRFQQLVQGVLQQVRDSVLTNEEREGFILENPAALKELNKQVEGLLIAFHGVFNSLAFTEENEEDDLRIPVVSQLIGVSTSLYKTGDNHVPVWEQRLLTTLANCQYTRTVIFPNLLDFFGKSGYPLPKTPVENVSNKLDTLERSILEAYLEQKSDPLVGTIEPSMYLGRFDWDTKITPTDIRPYTKECVNNLIHVHSEINSISPVLVNSVLPHVVQTVAEELYRLMSCVQKFSVPGIQQARADICALQEFFSDYSTEKARSFFRDALEVIPQLPKSESTIIEDILKQCKINMRLQILCLTNPHCNGPGRFKSKES